MSILASISYWFYLKVFVVLLLLLFVVAAVAWRDINRQRNAYYWHVLCRLEQYGRCMTAETIAWDLGIDSHTVGMILDLQDEQGFVIGAYEQPYIITPQGREAIIGISAELQAAGLPVPKS